jgi:hypothetical protein
MNRKHVLRCVAALLLLLPGPAIWAQSQDQPSLGDVARQKRAVKARRVVTNDEIPPSPEANNPPASSSAAGTSALGPAAKPGTTPAAKPDGNKSDSAPDKQTKLQELMTDREHLQNALKKMQDTVAETDDQQRRATLGQVVKHAQEALEANQKEIDKLRASGAAAADPAVATPLAADHSPAGQKPPK